MPAEFGVVAIIRLREHRPPRELFEALRDGGITRLEVTWPTPGAREVIADWRGAGAHVGAGTIRTAAQAVAAIGAGAEFLVTPTIDHGVLDAAASADLPVLCGASTPTEIERAHRHRAVEAVKVFPAGALGGASYIKAVTEPLDDVPLLPTGGVGRDEAYAYAVMGCVGVGVGGSLVNEQVVAAQDWSEVRRRAEDLVRAWERGVAERAR